MQNLLENKTKRYWTTFYLDHGGPFYIMTSEKVSVPLKTKHIIFVRNLVEFTYAIERLQYIESEDLKRELDTLRSKLSVLTSVVFVVEGKNGSASHTPYYAIEKY